MRNGTSILILLITSVLLWPLHYRCANVIQPTGGPRDSIPPVLIQADPENQSINYTGNTFSFEFDEKIKTDKLRDQLIITPRTEADYDLKYSKRGVTLVFDEPFQDSTTYTFNFREGIVDATEGNPTEDNKFVFSTGPNIDSLRIGGHVTVLLSLDTLAEVTVGLYDMEDTINIFNGSPYYFTQTDEEGHFTMENLRNGSYRLYAFQDGNKNLELETNSEQYGFVPDTLMIKKDTTGYHIRLISLDLRQLELMSALPSGHYFDFNYNKYLTNYEIAPIETQYAPATGFAKDHKAVRFYNTFNEPDSIPVAVTAYDSLNLPVTDTAYIKFLETSRKKESFKMQVNPAKNTAIKEQFDLEIILNKPVRDVVTDSIFVQFDTTRLFTPVDTVFEWNFNRNQLTIPVQLNRAEADSILKRRERREQRLADSLKNAVEETPAETREKKQVGRGDLKTETSSVNQGLQLVIGTGAFISADGDSTERATYAYKFIIPEDFGTISGSLETAYENFFVQLLNEQLEVLQEIEGGNQYQFTNVPPGKYRIRVLIDANNDGHWSPGNMREDQLPEPVYFFSEVIAIRANWELNQDLRF